ncbi:MAG: hypothetical protein HC848_00320 [Limnobacter sp.]|nr:hypothetical protein [Limnobacter sp.]
MLVNWGSGTGPELQELVALVQSRVLAQFGVHLEPEPNLVGMFEHRGAWR